jgi:hypothetical protein
VGTKAIDVVDGRCHGITRRGPRKGLPCGAHPEAGSTVCHHHGGALPRVRAAAAYRVARDEAQAELGKRMKALDEKRHRDAIELHAIVEQLVSDLLRASP